MQPHKDADDDDEHKDDEDDPPDADCGREI